VTRSSPESDPAALRDQIRSAGCRANTLGWRVAGLYALVILVSAPFCGAAMGESALVVAGQALFLLLGGSLVLIGIGGSVSELYCRLQARRFRRRLAQLPPEQREEVLAPLQEAPTPEVREILQPLLRAFGAPRSEVIPAPPATDSSTSHLLSPTHEPNP
jgi:hypothetical protein